MSVVKVIICNPCSGFQLTIPNGLAWNSERTKFFYIDSPDKNVWVYDYDNATGNISKSL